MAEREAFQLFQGAGRRQRHEEFQPHTARGRGGQRQRRSLQRQLHLAASPPHVQLQAAPAGGLHEEQRRGGREGRRGGLRRPLPAGGHQHEGLLGAGPQPLGGGAALRQGEGQSLTAFHVGDAAEQQLGSQSILDVDA